MIGRFALACLDMAGTTVRDDGAVDAAFTSALAAVGVTPGSRFYEEAEVVVHETMGWSKADVFARLFDADEAAEATRAFAAAYEAIVAGGEVAADPRRPRRCCATCAPPASRSASPRGSPRRPATPSWTPWAGAPRSTWPSRRPTSAGAAPRRT